MQEQAKESMHESTQQKPNEPEDIEVNMNILRRTLDSLLGISPPTGLLYRKRLLANVKLSQFPMMTRKEILKFIIVKLSESNPILLVVGALCWMYIVTFVVLKLTVLT